MSKILHLRAEWHYDRLPALAAELVRRRVAVIFALWNVSAVQQASRVDTVLNLKAAKALGINVPPTLLGLATEVIE
jgi:hypothetical protein